MRLAKRVLLPALLSALRRCAAGNDLLLDDGCWAAAQTYINVTGALREFGSLAQAEEQCKHYSDANKTIIALLISECHLAKRSGRPGCLTERVVADEAGALLPGIEKYRVGADVCMKRLSDTEFTSYTQFYAHIESICFLVHADLWHKKARMLMLQLHQNSEEVNQQLQVAYDNNMELIKQQSLALDSQKSLLALSNNISSSLYANNAKLDSAFAAIEQRLVHEHDSLRLILNDIYAIINNVSKVQQYFKNKYLNFESVVLYVFLVYLTRLLTSNAYTNDARYKLILLWVGSYFCEVSIRAHFGDALGAERRIAGSLGQLGAFVRLAKLPSSALLVAAFRSCVFSIASLYWLNKYFTYVDPRKAEMHELRRDLQALHRKIDFVLRTSQFHSLPYERAAAESKSAFARAQFADENAAHVQFARYREDSATESPLLKRSAN